MSDWLHGIRVPALRISDLRDIATVIRSRSNLGREDPFPALHFLEWSMFDIVDNFDFEVVSALPDGNEACAFPDGASHHPHGPVIQMLQSAYDQAVQHNGRARLTALHECGHVLLHRHVAVHHRGPRGSDLKPWENSEWQANQFAAELLMPVESLDRPGDFESYVRYMGVSREASCNRVLQLERTLRMPLPKGWPVYVYASAHRNSQKGGPVMSP